MANREELHIIRAARAGHATAQLALGKRYLFGGAGLPRNSATALYWLDRAAQQQERDAWVLIGSYIPFETACHATNLNKLCYWYERAFDAGVIQAGLVLAKMVLAQPELIGQDALRRKAMQALQAAARAGIPDAQWLLAQQFGKQGALSLAMVPDAAQWRGWAERAAQAGVLAARHALANYGWEKKDDALFLHWALPLARNLVQRNAGSQMDKISLAQDDITLLVRCATALERVSAGASPEIRPLWQLAAEAGDRQARFALGLSLAKMTATGARVTAVQGGAYYKKAIRWLMFAGEQGLADAWYAISKIYLKPEFSHRNLADAQRYLERAAWAGQCAAQYEMGGALWRARHAGEGNDVQAVYWLQKAAAQGSVQAQLFLDRIAPRGMPASWAVSARERITREQATAWPFLAARIELAARFGLSLAEALLLDIHAADHGHCLVVDIRQQHPRSKRRLIRIETGEERQQLDRIMRLFEDVDCSPEGPEGNYRRRLYRLRSLRLA